MSAPWKDNKIATDQITVVKSQNPLRSGVVDLTSQEIFREWLRKSAKNMTSSMTHAL